MIGGERQALSSNLCRLIMQFFAERYTDKESSSFKYTTPSQAVKILEKYTEHGWMEPGFYNTMLNTLGSKFDRMSPYEVSSAVNSFAKIGIFQEDVISSSIKRINALAKGELPNIKHSSKGRFA